MIAVAEWLRIWILSVEVSSLTNGKFFSILFMHLFYPMVTVLLEYFNPRFTIAWCLVTLQLSMRFFERFEL